MKMQKALEQDLPKILDLQTLCYTETAERYNDFTIAPMNESIDEITKEYQTINILKACDGNKIIGSIRAEVKDETCYIGRVIVHPDYQNKGIGRTLMTEAERLCKDVKRFELFTGNKDEKNLAFYSKLGYKQFNSVPVNDVLTMIFLEKLQ